MHKENQNFLIGNKCNLLNLFYLVNNNITGYD